MGIYYRMEIKIDATVPCGVFFEGNQYVTPFSLQTKTSSVGQMTILPVNPEDYSAYSLTFTIEEDRLRALSGGANAVSWGSGLCEIQLSPPHSQKNLLPEVIAQQKANNNQVTLYFDGTPKIMCEGYSFFVKDLPQNLKKKAKESFRRVMYRLFMKSCKKVSSLLTRKSRFRYQTLCFL